MKRKYGIFIGASAVILLMVSMPLISAAENTPITDTNNSTKFLVPKHVHFTVVNEKNIPIQWALISFKISTWAWILPTIDTFGRYTDQNGIYDTSESVTLEYFSLIQYTVSYTGYQDHPGSLLITAISPRQTDVHVKLQPNGLTVPSIDGSAKINSNQPAISDPIGLTLE